MGLERGVGQAEKAGEPFLVVVVVVVMMVMMMVMSLVVYIEAIVSIQHDCQSEKRRVCTLQPGSLLA